MEKNTCGFDYLKEIYPALSKAKLYAGVLTGPQIRTILRDNKFKDKLNEKESRAWNAFEAVANGFLGNNKDAKYESLVDELFQSHKSHASNLSLKIDFPHSNFNFFPFDFQRS